MSGANNTNGFMGGLLLIFVFMLLMAALIGSASNSSLSGAPSQPSSAEQRYVEERFRQEGYSRAESEQAAAAVLKFHRAQQAR